MPLMLREITNLRTLDNKVPTRREQKEQMVRGNTALLVVSESRHSADYWFPTRKTTFLHGVKSRLLSAKQGKIIQKNVWQRAPPGAARSEKIKVKITWPVYMLLSRRYAGLGPSCVRTRIISGVCMYVRMYGHHV